MKTFIAVLVIGCGLGSGVGQCQTPKPIDWKPCQAVTDQFKDAVEKFNAEHKDGFSIMLTCTYSGDPAKKNKPEKHVALTANEIAHLHSLRKIEDAAFAAMSQYEAYLFRAHRVPKPDINLPCYYYAGIQIDKDYITIDQNSMDPECDGIQERAK